MIKVFKELFNFCKPYKRDIVIVLIALISVSINLLFIGTLIKNFIDNGLKLENINNLNQTALLTCLLIIFFAISSFFRSYYINSLTEKVINNIKLITYENTLKLTITQFEELKIGDIVTRLDGDLDQVAKLITNFLSFFIRNTIMLMGALVLMFLQTVKLSVLVIIVVPLLLFPLIKLGRYAKFLAKENVAIKSLITSDLIETFSNIRIIHAFNKENDKIKIFKSFIDNYLISTISRLKIRSLFFALSVSIILITIVFVIWLGSRDILKGAMSAGQMTSFIYYSIMAAMSGVSIAELFSELNTPLNAAGRIFELMSLFKANVKNTNNKILQHIHSLESIEFKNVSFCYPSRPNIKALNNVSFKILKDKFIGIMGQSGSGKSTILQLLLKFYYPTYGVITVNNNNLLEIIDSEVRSFISYVPQEANILAGTIKSNIIFSRPTASEEEINEVVNITGLDSFIKDLPDKLATEIGERGVKLSGGQKQRIAIARALITNTEILLLDEATSALDIEGEKKLILQLQESMRHKIIISVSHRIASLEYADKILIMDKGTLIAQGSHEELLKNSLYYQYLCKEQHSFADNK